MSDYVISCCSTADLSKEHFEKIDVHYCCFHYEMDGVQYSDDLGQSMDFDVFYQRMTDGAMTKTSQINADEYEEYFAQFLSQGKDVIHLTLSSGISGTFNSANLAKALLEDKYPDRKIYVIDSLAASSGYGLLVDHLAGMRDSGATIDELAAWVEEHKLNLNHWFFSSDLTFFIRGGRISKAAGAVGTVLNICPLMNVDFEGRLIPRHKIRTKKKVIQAIVGKMAEQAEGGTDYNGKRFISHSACDEDPKAVAALVDERSPTPKSHVLINSIGTTIGSQTGPGTVALFFWGQKRVD